MIDFEKVSLKMKIDTLESKVYRLEGELERLKARVGGIEDREPA